MGRLTSVLDAWAAVAFIRGEPAAPRVRRALEEGALISSINLGEVLYTLARRSGDERASEAVRSLRGLLETEVPGWETTQAAAMVKAHHKLSYADAFAVATAQRHSAPLLTGDPEIVALRDIVDIVDLRKETE